MKTVGGIKRFSVDGVALDVVELGGFSIADKKQETVNVLAGEPGIKVSPTVPYVEVTISTRGIKIADYVGQNGVTVQLELANGRTYVWSDASEVGDGQVDPADGKLTLKYESVTAQEL